ncbi:fructuronate reductase [Clostridium acidisoli DSM 12555]|uniref:Fructuronate reductase n=1 Tax=Clostridium acidisoli DSM 12555 TaxID=1121291 RepID=A0A1W1XS52_9CLOT|nr:mannitol dehydrogenase family protein [Clostridium acidisoli]SMC26726.1 fructuronate reductase [Clostridium acidisoli DSM 12555]
MYLNNNELDNIKQWQRAEISIPKFNRTKMIEATKKDPFWIHFGAGNIFRAFPAALQQKLLDDGYSKRGIIVAEGYDYEIIDKIYRPHDNLSLLVTLKSDGTIDKKVIGSIAESLKVDSDNKADFSRLKEIFRAKSLEMVSFTITEKGYSLVDGSGKFLADVVNDFSNGPKNSKSYIGKVSALCFERYKFGAYPVAMVSMDNCSHNGSKLYSAIHEFASKWLDKGLVDKGFLDYIENPEKISFTWSMIDKITPRPDVSVKNMLQKCGFKDTEGIITTKKTYIAPFVNSEESQYLVIENNFPNGRPQLDKTGVIFAQREIVDKVEKMKVCTCLNPLHTALAIFGCLLKYKKISDEMKDKDLVKLVEEIGYKEGLPVVVDPGIISPRKFLDEVLKVRVPNPFMPDTPQRIATDTSQKLAIRFGETIKAYLANDKLNIKDLKFIPLVLAAWCRYLLGVDDDGKSFDISPDPMLDTLDSQIKDLKLGEDCAVHTILQPILSDSTIFAVDLYKAGLGEVVEKDFSELMEGPGAVRATLRRHLANK